MKDWRPRWYYIMRNVTTGMLYVGQTYNLTTRSYCGSGKYWVTHCKKHAEKDPVTGKSYHAVKVGKASGVTRGLMKQFCKEHGIDSPGVNYINMDKSAFKQWRAQHAG